MGELICNSNTQYKIQVYKEKDKIERAKNWEQVYEDTHIYIMSFFRMALSW